MFYILHGDNELERSEQIADFKRKIGDESMRDLNVTVLDGRKVTLGELQHAADAMPFLADKRLVIVEGLLTRLAARRGKADDGGDTPSGAAKDYLAGLLAYLPRLPESTRLVLVEAQPMKETHPVMKLARQQGSKTVIEFRQPAASDLPRWIAARARGHGGAIEPRAAGLLSQLIGGDLRRLDQELVKLITYVDAQRPITEEDVAGLVADAGQSSVFDMVDALGRRDGRAAARELHRLLDGGENPLGLLAMIVRQFRLLILAKEWQARALPPDQLARELGVHPFVARKIGEQARTFRDAEQLVQVYHRLLDLEVEIKSGQTPDGVALDLLVAGLAG